MTQWQRGSVHVYVYSWARVRAAVRRASEERQANTRRRRRRTRKPRPAVASARLHGFPTIFIHEPAGSLCRCVLRDARPARPRPRPRPQPQSRGGGSCCSRHPPDRCPLADGPPTHPLYIPIHIYLHLATRSTEYAISSLRATAWSSLVYVLRTPYVPS